MLGKFLLFTALTVPGCCLLPGLGFAAEQGKPLFPVKVAENWRLPLSAAENNLKNDRQALAALRHQQAMELKREYFQDGSMKKLYTALNTVGEAIALDPEHAQFWVTLGALHSELSKFNLFRSNEYAQEAFRQAIELDPDDAPTMVLLALNLAKTGDYEEALDFFEKAVAANILMLNADIAQWMNVCYLVDGHTKRGIIFYENIQKSHPQYTYLNLYQAVLYQAHFDFASARRELEPLVVGDDAEPQLRETARQLLDEINAAEREVQS